MAGLARKSFHAICRYSLSGSKCAWAGRLGLRTTLIQNCSMAAENHGWPVVEVNLKYSEFDDAFGPLPDLESHAEGDEAIVFTILSERDESIANS